MLMVSLCTAWGLLASVSAATQPAASSYRPQAGDAAESTPAGDSTGSPRAVDLLVGRHERVILDDDARRVAVASPEVVTAELLDTRELLLTAGGPGVTAVTVWFDAGDPLELTVSVGRDLSVLAQLLSSIDPRIEVEFVPERDIVMLRGVVDDAGIREAAAATAEAFVRGGSGASRSLPALLEGEGGEALNVVPEPGGPPGGRPSGVVVNLLRLTALPSLLEERITAAIAPIGGPDVTVHRIQVGGFPDDAVDVFHLDGTVADQVALTRLLFIASRAITGGSNGNRGSDIRVIADESGALTQARNVFGSGGGQQSGGQQSGGLQAGGTGTGGARNRGNQLVNRIGAQVARAKAVEAAGGRILSTIKVEHLPFVRVDLRLYEVNTSRLRSWRNQLSAAGSNFDQPALQPTFQGAGSPTVADGDVQGLLNFLNGTLSGRGQLVSGGFALDNLFQVLVEDDVARSLSHPSLAVLSGELAQFHVGGQIPIPVARTIGSGSGQVLNSVEFRDFGINLSVRPLVEERSSSRITLDVTPSITLPDLTLTAAIGTATGQAAPATAFESRATRTSARIYDGESVVIGGLSTSVRQTAQSRAPIVGSIPVLGWLFRNEATDREETELVIMVTASVVQEPNPEAALWSYPSTNEVLQRCLDRVSSGDRPEVFLSTVEPIDAARH